MKKTLISIINIIKIAIAIWGFLIAFLFATNGFNFLNDKKYILASIVFAISIIYCIILSLSLHFSLEEKRSKKETKHLRNLNFFKKILKLVILILSVVFSTNIFDINSLIRTMNVAWVIVTLIFDIAYYTLRIIIKRFKESFSEGK